MRPQLILLFCCVFSTLATFSQEIIGKAQTDYSSKLPEVLAIQKAVDIPVSPFTGQANISLPIYTVKSGSLSVPITLDYSSGGIKADEKGGMYGLGWTLNAGGSIVRVVRGNEDEGLRYETKPHRYTQTVAPTVYYIWGSIRDSIINATQKYGGFYIDNGNTGHLTSDLYTKLSAHNTSLSNGGVPSYSELPYFYNGLSDGEPDIFYFKFGEHSGKFIFGPNNAAPILLPYNQDIQITVDLKHRLDSEIVNLDTTVFRSHYFNSFKISTADGKDYYFGETEASKIYTPIFRKPNMYNGWQLTRIIDRNTADTIYFDYGGTAPANVSELQTKQQFVRNDGSGCPSNPKLNMEIQQNYKGNLLSITTSKEKVRWTGMFFKVIDKNTGTAFRQFQFTTFLLASGRRTLKNFIEQDMLLNKNAMYTFEYYSQGAYGGRSAQDFWGYHNGVDNGDKLMIGYSGCTSDGANRFAAWPAMQLDALSSISYPTGGKTIFEYEGHEAYSGRNLNNQIAESDAYFVGQNLNFNLITPNSIGGLRIKRIMQYDPVSKDTLIKRYIYKRFGTNISSGHLYMPPSLNTDYSALTCGGGKLSPLYLRSTQNQYIGSGTSQHVSYNNVTVQEEKNGVSNGYTEYEYYNDLNVPDSSFYSNALTDSTNASLNDQYNIFPSTQYKRLPENFLDGKEKEKRVYSRNGTLLMKETTIYKSKVYAAYNQKATLFNAIYKKEVCDISVPSGGGYSAADGPRSSQFLRDAMQDMCDIVNKSMGYTSCTVDEETGPFVDNGKAGVRPILPPPYSYYYMYRYTTSKVAVRPYQVIRKTYESPLKTITDTTTYLYENPDHVNATSVITRSSKGDVTKQQTLYSFDFKDVNNGDSAIYFMKKAFVNLPVASFSYTNGNISSGGYRVYKYKSRADSTVFFANEEYSLLSSQTGTLPASINISTTYPQTFNMPSAYFQKAATYKYNPDNSIAYVIKKGNEKTILQWDYNKAYVVSQASGADSADIAFTSFETNYDGNWMVAGVARDTTSFMTGKKSYSLSGGSITRTGLNTSKIYIVSYWSSTTAATVNAAPGVLVMTKNGWNCYEHKLPASTASITISGNVKIDELRLYPSDAQPTTYTFNPVLGITTMNAPDNTIMYYEYDGIGRLRFIRDADKNIIKAASYYSTYFASDTALWRETGSRLGQKCTSDTNYYSTTSLKEEININPNSPTYNTTRWMPFACNDCDVSAWKNTTTANRCVKDANNNNNGYVEREQKDMNPCSPTYNQLRWVSAGVNASACPLPPPPCTGDDKRIINGVCVTGTRIGTASVYVPAMHKWSCQYHYEWLPDCVRSIDYTEYRSTPCVPGGSCTPL